MNRREVTGRDGAGHDGVPRDGARHGGGAEVRRLSQVLAGLEFPAAKWQIVIHAEDYGADAASRSQLWTLAPQTYPDLTAVFAALGLTPAGRRVRSGRPPGGRRTS